MATVLCKLKVLELFVHMFPIVLSNNTFIPDFKAVHLSGQLGVMSWNMKSAMNACCSEQIKSLHMSISAYECSLSEVG